MRLRTIGLLAVGLLLIGAMPAAIGCKESSPKPGAGSRTAAESANIWQDELFSFAIDNLNRLEEFSHREMLDQIVGRLNQWGQSQKPSADWRRDPLLDTLPEPLTQLPMLKDLGKIAFPRYDGFALQEAVWMRDVSNWARGEGLDDLGRAEKLFDWTVRNIQLERQPAGPRANRVSLMPWEVLLLGQGTATERAWVFVLLARQQNIDAVLLALPDSKDPDAKKSDAKKPGAKKPGDRQPPVWAVGVLIEKQLYVFDPTLGLPIPAPDGVKLDGAGQLAIKPATLAQLVADDSLLRRLDIKDRPYPVKSSQLADVVALVEGSPSYLAARMELVQSHLAGEQKTVLTASPSKLAKRVEELGGMSDVRFWTWPYEAMLQQKQLNRAAMQQKMLAMMPFQVGEASPLWKGRLLHFKGKFTGDRGAMHYYQQARPSNADLRAANFRPPDVDDPRAAEEMARALRAIVYRAKQDGSYWLGLIAYHRGKCRAAADYFDQRTLEASPSGPWTQGASYNLARTAELDGQPGKAVRLYRSDLQSPAQHGNLLRAEWLEDLHAKGGVEGKEGK